VKRHYTGIEDGLAAGKRAGTEKFVELCIKHSGGKLWNNGTFGNRAKRGGSTMSVHATGRAMDLSYRNMKDGKRGGATPRKTAVEWCEIFTKNADLLGVECILDYFPQPFGRGWRCDRETGWKNYTKLEIHGAPNGDWLHVELSPAMADDPKRVIEAFAQIFPA
jgi:hypothetical protein